jgi:hypothetical protein
MGIRKSSGESLGHEGRRHKFGLEDLRSGRGPHLGVMYSAPWAAIISILKNKSPPLFTKDIRAGDSLWADSDQVIEERSGDTRIELN